jgi:hypothetical protein
MAIRGLKRPRDPSQLGKLIVDIATGQADDRAPAQEERPASNFAKKGGKARAAKLSAKRWQDRAASGASPMGNQQQAHLRPEAKTAFHRAPRIQLIFSVYVFG